MQFSKWIFSLSCFYLIRVNSVFLTLWMFSQCFFFTHTVLSFKHQSCMIYFSKHNFAPKTFVVTRFSSAFIAIPSTIYAQRHTQPVQWIMGPLPSAGECDGAKIIIDKHKWRNGGISFNAKAQNSFNDVLLCGFHFCYDDVDVSVVIANICLVFLCAKCSFLLLGACVRRGFFVSQSGNYVSHFKIFECSKKSKKNYYSSR